MFKTLGKHTFERVSFSFLMQASKQAPAMRPLFCRLYYYQEFWRSLMTSMRNTLCLRNTFFGKEIWGNLHLHRVHYLVNCMCVKTRCMRQTKNLKLLHKAGCCYKFTNDCGQQGSRGSMSRQETQQGFTSDQGGRWIGVT